MVWFTQISGKYLFFSFLFSTVFNVIAANAQQIKSNPSQQGSFPENMLKQFVKVNQDVKKIEHIYENKLIEAIKAENLEIARFNTLLKAQQNKELQTLEASTEELAAFHAAVPKVQAIQQAMSVEITKLVEQEIGIEQYKTIMHAYQRNNVVKQRVDSIFYY